jgi:tocopherol cyclase
MKLPGFLPSALTDRVTTLKHPEAGHDIGRNPYFEGWYVKLVSADREHRLAVIPGLFRGEDGAQEAFVQVLDGANGRSWYVPYDAADFWAGRDEFTVQVGPNRFTRAGAHLDIADGPDGLVLRGDVAFTSGFAPWPVTLRSPGAMGWYAYMPFMECYHGVVSFSHGLSGQLQLGDDVLGFDGGRGYIEQDWGQAFPAGYVWIHSNHFDDPALSLMASVAIVPWLRGQFRGLMIGLRTRDGFHRFATYTGATSDVLTIDDEHVALRLRARNGQRLTIQATREGGALLHAPARAQMHRRVEETLTAQVHVLLTDRHGTVLVDDIGDVAGLEVHGELDRLMRMSDR